MKWTAVVLCVLVVLPLMAQCGNIGKGHHKKKEHHAKSEHAKPKHKDEIVVEIADKHDGKAETNDDGFVHLNDEDQKELDELMSAAEKEEVVKMPSGEQQKFLLKHEAKHQDKKFLEFQKKEYERFEKHRFFQYQLAQFQEAQRQLEAKLQMERQLFESRHGEKMMRDRKKHSYWLKKMIKKGLHERGPLKFDPDNPDHIAAARETEKDEEKEEEMQLKQPEDL